MCVDQFFVSSIFDASQSVNPGETALGRGLSSWAQFGTSVSGPGMLVREMREGRGRGPGRLDSLAIAQHLCNTDLKPRARIDTGTGPGSRVSRGYGAWYTAPSQWNQKFKKSSQTNVERDKYSLEAIGEFSA